MGVATMATAAAFLLGAVIWGLARSSVPTGWVEALAIATSGIAIALAGSWIAQRRAAAAAPRRAKQEHRPGDGPARRATAGT